MSDVKPNGESIHDGGIYHWGWGVAPGGQAEQNLSGDNPKYKRGRILRDLKTLPDFEGEFHRGEAVDELPVKGTTRDFTRWSSATVNPKVAEDFAARNHNSENHKTVWKIKGKAKNYKDHPDVPRNLKHEKEVVVPAGSRVLVKDVKKRTDSEGRVTWDVDAEQLYRELEEMDRHALNPYEDYEAAIWHPTHGIHVGPSHPHVMFHAMLKGVDLSDDRRAIDGFYDNATNRFLTRKDVLEKGESADSYYFGKHNADGTGTGLSDRSIANLPSDDRLSETLDNLTNIGQRAARSGYKNGDPDWSREVTRHALTGASAVCDKRVWRPQDEGHYLAAVRYPDGAVYVGTGHREAWYGAMEDGREWQDDVEEGFTGPDHRFVTRKEFHDATGILPKSGELRDLGMIDPDGSLQLENYPGGIDRHSLYRSAAVRVGNGKVFEGLMHVDAIHEAVKEGHDIDWDRNGDPKGHEEGFVTHDGRFHNRDQAEIFTGESESEALMEMGEYDPDATDRHAESEGLYRSAAIRHKGTGKIYEGSWHGDAIEQAKREEEEGYNQKNWDHGFVTHGGEYHSRDEAGRNVFKINAPAESAHLRSIGQLGDGPTADQILEELDRHAESEGLYRSAAIRHKGTGRIVEGWTHPDAYGRADALGMDPYGDNGFPKVDEYEDGFMTHGGEFHDREAAAREVRKVKPATFPETVEMMEDGFLHVDPRLRIDDLDEYGKRGEGRIDRHVESDHRIREDQGDGYRIDTPHGFVQYRPTEHANEIWWIESHKKGHANHLMDLMLQHHPHDSVAWGATSEAGQAFRERWHAKNPHVTDFDGGERVPFEGQFDPFDHGEEPDDDLDDLDELDRHDMGAVKDWSIGGPDVFYDPNIGEKVGAEAKPFRGRVFRGEPMKNVPQPGDHHSWGRPVSSSKKRNVPIEHDFIQAGLPDHYPVLWEIEDVDGHDISDHPEHEYPFQHEVVIPKDSKFVVEHVQRKNDPDFGPYHHVWARQIPQSEYRGT